MDTSALIDFLRDADAGTAPVEELARLERESVPFFVPVVCCQELLQGARDEREWSALHNYLATQNLLAAADPWTTHAGAARLYYECRRSGVTVRSSVDCLIAQLTIESDGVLLHTDVDFERIASVHPLRLWSADSG